MAFTLLDADQFTRGCLFLFLMYKVMIYFLSTFNTCTFELSDLTPFTLLTFFICSAYLSSAYDVSLTKLAFLCALYLYFSYTSLIFLLLL